MPFLSDRALDHLSELAADPELAPERYEIREMVARGGMGVVYRAWDRDLDREVALKVLTLPHGEGEAASRMLAEAKILARLEHPGIVPVYESGLLADGRVFYAMRLVAGQRLDQVVASGPELAERLRIFGRIAETVAFAHAHGVVHRDLKPENVMVGPFGEVLVMDWGVAKDRRGGEVAGAARHAAGTGPAATGASAVGTAHGAVLGTPGYMAPEQARGDNERVDERSDVFALGALLAFLLTGQPPTLTGEPPSLAGLPRPLAAVCRKAMASLAEDRYPGAEALARDVAQYVAGLAVAAHPEGPMDWLGRVWRAYRAPILLVVAYLLMRVLFELWRSRGGG